MSKLQFIETTPEQLSELISRGVKKQLDEFKRDLSNQNNSNQLLTRKEVCSLLKIDLSTLYLWTKKGKLPSHKISNRVYYKYNEIIECLSS